MDIRCSWLSRRTRSTTLYDKLNFNFIRDFVPVASIGRGAFIVVVNPSVPVKTVPEFIAYAKANPGKINMASAGNGTSNHVFGESAAAGVARNPLAASSRADLILRILQPLKARR